jgi:hypothetical protein
MEFYRTCRASNSEGRDTRLIAKERRDDIRLTKMMFIMFATYLICFLPLLLLNVIDDEVDN